jgi:putative hydrolase of the HAD superfamily
MPLRGLIFDFDGLLVDTESAIVSAWEDIHAADGFRSDRSVLHALIGHVGVENDIWRAYPLHHDRAQLDARLQTIARKRCREAPVRPGVLALLDQAHHAGLSLAVASNSSHAHVEGHLEARGLLCRFHAVVCREDVVHGKPAPDLYLLALEKLGLGPHQAVAFEDSVPGHQAAATAGLRVIAVPNPATVADHFPHATLRVESMAELDLRHLEQLPLP